MPNGFRSVAGHARRLVSRASILSAAVSLALFAAPASGQAPAPDAAGSPALSQEVENSKFTTTGVIASNAVYVRCGPGDNYYPTQKLDKGVKVKVVGAKFDWLKIEPPDGSFCYVAKLYVDRHGDGKVGRVNKDSINVRAGSQLSALKIGILTELHQGEEVEITGEEQEYFRIKPPKGAYLYVNKRFVEPDPSAQPEPQKTEVAKTEAPKPVETPKPVEPAPQQPTPPVAEAAKPEGNPEVKPEVKPEVMKPESVAQAEPPKPEAVTTEPPKTNQPETTTTTPEKQETASKSAPPAPAPQPAPKPQSPAEWTPEQAEAEFDKAEAEFFNTRNQNVTEQPVESLLQRYEALAKSDKLPESMRRIAEARVPGLQVRAGAKAELARLKMGEDTLRQRQLALKAEQEELQRRIAETAIQSFAAVGTLQPSSLQQGKGGILYRVTDPATGRTVCYVRTNDPKILQQMGQFVGIKGDIVQDTRLGARVIVPKEITAVDPGKVHQSITAQIIPPSFIPKEASTAANQ